MLLPRRTFVAFDRSFGKMLVRRVRLAVLAAAAVTVAACGGGSSSSSGGGTMPPMPTLPIVSVPNPPTDIPAAQDADPVASNGRLSSVLRAGSRHVFRMEVPAGGMLRLEVTGANARITVFDGEGNELGTPDTGTLTVTIPQGGNVFVQVTPAPGATGNTGAYTLRSTFMTTPATTTPATTTAATMMMIPSG